MRYLNEISDVVDVQLSKFEALFTRYIVVYQHVNLISILGYAEDFVHPHDQQIDAQIQCAPPVLTRLHEDAGSASESTRSEVLAYYVSLTDCETRDTVSFLGHFACQSQLECCAEISGWWAYATKGSDGSQHFNLIFTICI